MARVSTNVEPFRLRQLSRVHAAVVVYALLQLATNCDGSKHSKVVPSWRLASAEAGSPNALYYKHQYRARIIPDVFEDCLI